MKNLTDFLGGQKPRITLQRMQDGAVRHGKEERKKEAATGKYNLSLAQSD